MVQRCCVPLCETKVGDLDSNGVKVRFHRLPLTPPEKLCKWRDQITNFGAYEPHPDLTVNSRICSKHFLHSDYITSEEQKPGTAGNHVLTKDALPTVFEWTDNEDETLSRAPSFTTKGEKRAQKEIQCSLHEEDEKLRGELFRKNMVIRQLLQRLEEIEEKKEPEVEEIPEAEIIVPETKDASTATATPSLTTRNVTIQTKKIPRRSKGTQTIEIISKTVVPATPITTNRVSVIRQISGGKVTPTVMTTFKEITKPFKKRKFSFTNS